MPTDQCDVVHIVNHMQPGGIETMVIDLVKQSRHRSRIFSLQATKAALLQGWPRLSVLEDRIDAFDRPPRLDPWLAVRLARRLRQLSPRTVILHRTAPLLFGGVAARVAGVPNVVHVEHDAWQLKARDQLRLLQWATRLVRPSHVAVSTEVADALRNILPGSQVRVVTGGIDLSRFSTGDRTIARRLLELPPGRPIIGSAGRLEQVKGHRFLIEAMKFLPSEALLVLVGNGSELPALQSLAQSLGLTERVHFLGHRDDLERILPALDVFCLPSLAEGLPRVLMETQGAGIAVVASDVGSVRQIVDTATGRLVPPGDSRALATALAATLAAPPSASDCRRYAEANFPIERMVAEYDAMTT